MKKGIMKIILTVLIALCIGVFAGNVSSYKVAYAEEANSTTEEVAEETVDEGEELKKELLGALFFPVEAVLPEFIDAFFPQSFKEEVHSCVSGIGGITGGVALGIAAVALLKKKH